MTPNDEQVLALMWAAWRTTFGMAVTVSDVETFRTKFYRLRKLAASNGGDGALYELSCRTSPNNPLGEIWLVKGVREDGEAGGTGESDNPPDQGGQGDTG